MLDGTTAPFGVGASAGFVSATNLVDGAVVESLPRSCWTSERSPHRRPILDANATEESMCDVGTEVVVAVHDSAIFTMRAHSAGEWRSIPSSCCRPHAANHVGDVSEARMSAQSGVVGTWLSTDVGRRKRRTERSIQRALQHIWVGTARA